MTKGKVRTSKENAKAQMQQNIYAFNFWLLTLDGKSFHSR